MKPRIYLYLADDVFNDPRGVALAQDGVILWEHLYVSAEVAIKAMSGKLRQYREKYPDGYELVIAQADDPGFVEALRLSTERWEAGAAEREAEHARQMAAKVKRFAIGAEIGTDDGDDLAVNQPDFWPDD